MSILDLSTFWQTNPTERSAAAAFSRGWRSCHWPCWQCAQLVAPGARNRQQIKTPMFLRSSLQNDIIDLLERCHHKKKKATKKKGILKNSCPPRGHETNSKSSIDFLKWFLLAHPMTNQSMSANRLWSGHVRRCQDTGVAFVKSSGTKYDGIWATSRLRSKGTPKRKQVQVGSVGSHIITSTEVYYVENKYLYSVKKQD